MKTLTRIDIHLPPKSLLKSRYERLQDFKKTVVKDAKSVVFGAVILSDYLFGKHPEPYHGSVEAPDSIYDSGKNSSALAKTRNHDSVLESVTINNQVLRVGKNVVSSTTTKEFGRHVVELSFEDGSSIRVKVITDGIETISLCRDGIRTTIQLEDALSHISSGVISGVSVVSGHPGNDGRRVRLPSKPPERCVVVFQMQNGDSIEFVGIAGSISVLYRQPFGSK